MKGPTLLFFRREIFPSIADGLRRRGLRVNTLVEVEDKPAQEMLKQTQSADLVGQLVDVFIDTRPISASCR